MKNKLTKTISTLIWAIVLFAAYAVAAHAQTDATRNPHPAKKSGVVQTAASTTPVTGNGTTGQMAKWTTANTLGDSSISEDKLGHVGIGTTASSSRLAVAGVIESTAGGVKFPDGTVQTTALSQTSSPTLQPFAQNVTGHLPLGTDSANAMINVPAGKRLVIETESLFITLPFNQIFENFSIQTTIGGQAVLYTLFPTQVFTNDSTHTAYGITQPLKIYADPGTQIIASISIPFVSPGGFALGFNLSISGYLVDVP